MYVCMHAYIYNAVTICTKLTINKFDMEVHIILQTKQNKKKNINLLMSLNRIANIFLYKLFLFQILNLFLMRNASHNIRCSKKDSEMVDRCSNLKFI